MTMHSVHPFCTTSRGWSVSSRPAMTSETVVEMRLVDHRLTRSSLLIRSRRLSSLVAMVIVGGVGYNYSRRVYFPALAGPILMLGFHLPWQAASRMVQSGYIIAERHQRHPRRSDTCVHLNYILGKCEPAV